MSGLFLAGSLIEKGFKVWHKFGTEAKDPHGLLHLTWENMKEELQNCNIFV